MSEKLVRKEAPWETSVPKVYFYVKNHAVSSCLPDSKI